MKYECFDKKNSMRKNSWEESRCEWCHEWKEEIMQSKGIQKCMTIFFDVASWELRLLPATEQSKLLMYFYNAYYYRCCCFCRCCCCWFLQMFTVYRAFIRIALIFFISPFSLQLQSLCVVITHIEVDEKLQGFAQNAFDIILLFSQWNVSNFSHAKDTWRNRKVWSIVDAITWMLFLVCAFFIAFSISSDKKTNNFSSVRNELKNFSLKFVLIYVSPKHDYLSQRQMKCLSSAHSTGH